MQQSNDSNSPRIICFAASAACLAPTPVNTAVTCTELNSAACTSSLLSFAGLKSCEDCQGANSFSSAKVTRILTAIPYAAAACATDFFPAPASKYPCCSYQLTARPSAASTEVGL